jgi:hypothetical protein
LQLIEVKGTQSGDLYEKYLLRCDNAISKALLGNALSTEIQTTGARSSTETGAVTIEGDLGQTDRDMPVAFYNELFKRVVDLNIGSGKYPTFAVNEIEDAKTDFAVRDKTLSEAASSSGQKIKRTKDFYVNKYNYDPDEFELIDDVLPVSQPQIPIDPATGLPIKNPAPGIRVPEPVIKAAELSAFKKVFNKLFGKNIELQDEKKLTFEQLADALPEKLLQFQLEEPLQPVLELAKNSTSRDEFIVGLAKQYPKMETKQIENLAAKVFFIAEIEGRKDAGEQ